LLPDDTVSSLLLSKILYVLDIEGILFSWYALKSTENVYLEDKDKILLKKLKDNSIIFVASESSK
jgi:hypothetical protein